MSTVADEHAYRRLAERHRRELHAHCYRMLGSVQDAEDALQESLLAAWRGLAGFEGRSSLRAWPWSPRGAAAGLLLLRDEVRGERLEDDLAVADHEGVGAKRDVHGGRR